MDYSTDYEKKDGKRTGKEQVERDIDQCILESRSYADFKRRMVQDHYYQLWEGVSREHGVYLAPYTARERKSNPQLPIK